MKFNSFKLFLIVTAVSLVGAQEAKQGVVEEAEHVAFTSPLILTSSLAATHRTLWGTGGWFAIDEYKKLGAFTCDGISLRRNFHSQGSWQPGFEMAVHAHGSDAVELKTRVTVHNPEHNHDKVVTVQVTILDGDRVIGEQTIGPIDTEEGEEESGVASLVLPLSLLSRRPEPTVRLTVTAKDI
jgi:hypothetical protein